MEGSSSYLSLLFPSPPFLVQTDDEPTGNSRFYPYRPVHFTLSIYPTQFSLYHTPTAMISQLCPS